MTPRRSFVVTRQQVAVLFGFNDPHAADRLVAAGKIPAPFYPLANAPRWLRSDVLRARGCA